MPYHHDEDDGHDLDDRELPDESDMDDDDEQELLDPCPHCRKLLYDDTERCPHCCEYVTPSSNESIHPTWVIATAVVTLAVMIYFLVG